MIHIRIEAAGYVLKDSGRGYAVGKVYPKHLKTGETERIERPYYFSSLANAFRSLATEASTFGSPREVAFAQTLIAFALVLGKIHAGTGLALARRWGCVSKRELARKTGVSRATIKKIENQGGSPLLSTLLRLLSGCQVSRW